MRWLILFALATGCGVLRETHDAGATTGVNPALVERCSKCHLEIGASWSREFSHSLLFDCSQCHLEITKLAGTRHMQTRECASCHSETMHRSQPCTVCHDPHGSVNAFLVRTSFRQGEVRLTSAEGLSPNGLAHSDGTGVCEVCHTRTKYSRADGQGGPHPTQWCVDCHSHQRHFDPPP